MNEREMFEKSFERPKNFPSLSGEERWAIDKKLGILDWQGVGLTKEDIERFEQHYKLEPEKKKACFFTLTGIII